MWIDQGQHPKPQSIRLAVRSRTQIRTARTCLASLLSQVLHPSLMMRLAALGTRGSRPFLSRSPHDTGLLVWCRWSPECDQAGSRDRCNIEPLLEVRCRYVDCNPGPLVVHHWRSSGPYTSSSCRREPRIPRRARSSGSTAGPGPAGGVVARSSTRPARPGRTRRSSTSHRVCQIDFAARRSGY